jgi:hypothetical protein
MATLAHTVVERTLEGSIGLCGCAHASGERPSCGTNGRTPAAMLLT